MQNSIMLSAEMTENMPLGTLFHLLSKHYYGALAQKLKSLDIDRHYGVLLLIDQLDGEARQQDVADYMSMDKASVVRVLDALMEKGYVRRDVNKEDRRAYHLSLTAKGKKNIILIKKAVSALNNECLGDVPARNQALFMNILQQISVVVSDAPAVEEQPKAKKGKPKKK